ncbi:MAG: hypothetical protein AAGA30_09075 [Planctomycetota bacterium]
MSSDLQAGEFFDYDTVIRPNGGLHIYVDGKRVTRMAFGVQRTGTTGSVGFIVKKGSLIIKRLSVETQQ